jgi:prepilin-type processing-associated H-X9-DG protein
LVEVTYGDPYQVTTLNVHGGSTSRSITDEALIAAPQSAIEEARWQALVASDQNNLKQLGLINKMFANENCMYTIPGFCTVFPEYLTDPGVLTSPWDEPGTVSYELLFPAVTEEELEELGIQYLESKGDVDPNNPALSAQAQSVVPLIFNTTDIPAIGDSPAARNVLFLDGHVERLTLDAFEERVGPFLR